MVDRESLKYIVSRSKKIVEEFIKERSLDDIGIDVEELERLAIEVSYIVYLEPSSSKCIGVMERGFLVAYAYLYSRGYEAMHRGYTKCIKQIKSRLNLDSRFLKSAVDRAFRIDDKLGYTILALHEYTRGSIDPKTLVISGCRLAYLLMPDRYLSTDLMSRFVESVYRNIAHSNDALSELGVKMIKKDNGLYVEVPRGLCYILSKYGIPCSTSDKSL